MAAEPLWDKDESVHGYADCMVEVPPHAMGLVIGPRGETITRISREPGLLMCTLDQDPPKRGPGRFVVRGRPLACSKATAEVARLVASAAENVLRRREKRHHRKPYARPRTKAIFDFDLCRDGRQQQRSPPHKRDSPPAYGPPPGPDGDDDADEDFETLGGAG